MKAAAAPKKEVIYEKPTQFVQAVKYIKLVSSDLKVFFVNKDVCMISNHLKNVLTNNLNKAPSEYDKEEDTEEKPPLPHPDGTHLNITSDILEVCIKFMHYKTVNRKISFQRPNFDIDKEIALDVLKASIYLQV
uniref:Elongin-C n=1 Tax=Strombidium rassoulzadegani TaxID=1082188 RepID=A0A7S3CMD2_9SPIT